MHACCIQKSTKWACCGPRASQSWTACAQKVGPGARQTASEQKTAAALRRTVHVRPPTANSTDERSGLTLHSLLCLVGLATASVVAWPPRPRRRIHPVVHRVASRGVRRGRAAATGSTRLSTAGVGAGPERPAREHIPSTPRQSAFSCALVTNRVGRGRACRGSPQREGRVARPGGCSECKSTGGR